MTESPEMSSVTEALIEANDLLLGMYDLADVTFQSLDEAELVDQILSRAIRIVQADSLALETPMTRFVVGQHDRLPDNNGPNADGERTSVTASHSSGLTGELVASRSDRPFSTGDRKLLTAVLRTALTAVETSRLHARAIQHAIDANDHRRAAEVAQLALPQTTPEVATSDVFLQTVQARETGGDLCSFHDEADQLSFAVGDVSGKGLPAAVMMTTAVAATRAAFRDRRLNDPVEQLQSVNDWMFEHLSDAGLFMTLFIGHYRPNDGLLTWANAGHSPCAIATGDGVADLPPLSPPLGVLPLLDCSAVHTPLATDDLLLFGSDGLVEQSSESGEAFGERRLRKLLASARGSSAIEIGNHIMRTVAAFGGASPQSDDRTLMVLRHQPPRSSANIEAGPVR